MDALPPDVPPPPQPTPSLLPVFVESGRRFRLAYVAGFGDDRYEASDTVTGAVERFPLTLRGWEEAWRTWAARESGEAPVPALQQAAGEPPRRGRRVRRVLGVVGALALVAVVLSGWFLSGETPIFEDDFSGAREWEVHDDENGSLGYADGAYRIEVREAERELHSYQVWDGEPTSSVAFEADVRRAEGDGAVGLLCVSKLGPGTEFSEDDRYYDAFLVPLEGQLGIFASDEEETGAEASRPPLVRRREANRVRVECRGRSGTEPARVTLHVNGEHVLEYVDRDGYAEFVGVGFGVYAFRGRAVGLFDNARAAEL